MQSIEKKQFWEEKILKWEKTRYAEKADGQSLLERFAGRGSSSLRWRLMLAAEMLKRHLPGKVLLDVGCGSGILFNLLGESGAVGFIGIDIAEAGVEQARKLAVEHGYADRSTFIAGNIAELELPPFDVVVSLGLLDWLTDAEIGVLASKIKDKLFLISISEKRNSLEQFIHRLYVQISYGWRTAGYVPRYDEAETIARIFRDHGISDVKVYRDRRMSFGIFLHNLTEDSDR